MYIYFSKFVYTKYIEKTGTRFTRNLAKLGLKEKTKSQEKL
jgi:hypothetical protein